MPTIELSTFIAAPSSRCFDLARSVEFHTRSTGATGERAIAGRLSGLLGKGDEITWSARHFGIRQSLTVRITTFDPPHRFEDVMLRGAFASLRHDHIFESADGGTRMRDVFEYRAPFGLLGQFAERLFLTRYMRRLLEARNRELKAAAETEDWRRYLPGVV